MLAITPRICGICPVSHHLAAAKACDEIIGVQLTPTATMLRRLLHNAQFLQSHALHFFYLASPDLLFGMESDPRDAQYYRVITQQPETGQEGCVPAFLRPEDHRIPRGKKSASQTRRFQAV